MRNSADALRLSLAVALSLWSGFAAAADRPGLKELEIEAARMQRQGEDLRRNFTERSGLIGVSEARERYEDALYLYLVKDYESAATSFYILVQSRALGNMDLARDSEWYLAECLFELGNYRTAEEAYRSISDKGPQHPYFGDAIRRLLEVYAIIGDSERFDRYYNDFVVSGRVAATELINYTLAKSFYRRGEFNRSKAMFESLPPSSLYYGRARYFLGVLMIREKNYPAAIEEYQKVAAITPTDPEQQQVLELTHLALARLYYETGAFDSANEWYAKISETSPFFADKLYESVWTYVKQAGTAPDKESAARFWKDALDRVGIFLLAFPEHRYASSLKLLQGHLQMKLEAYEDARVAYERVVDEYTPLVARLEAVNGPDQLRRLLEGASGGDAAVSEKLPPFALGVLLGDDSVARAAQAWRTVEDQRAQLAGSERVVRDLEMALSGSNNVLGGFVGARQELDSIRGGSLSMRDQLLEAEAAWLRTRLSSTYRAEVSQILKERGAVLASLSEIDAQVGASNDRVAVYEEQVREVQQRAFRVAQVALEAKATAASTMEQVGQSKLSIAEANDVRSRIVEEQRVLESALADLESLQGEVVRRRIMRTVESPGSAQGDDGRRDAVLARYEELRRKLQAYRAYTTDPEGPAFFAAADKIWAALGALEVSTAETAHVLAAAEGRELAAVRSRLARESQRVVELRRDIEAGSQVAEALALKAVRVGVRDLAGEFREDILEADKGIVDVYWLRKSDASKRMEDLGLEQARLLRELDDQFRIVRENLDR
jgi:tetratricopeptide (TPR) repeat protein